MEKLQLCIGSCRCLHVSAVSGAELQAPSMQLVSSCSQNCMMPPPLPLQNTAVSTDYENAG